VSDVDAYNDHVGRLAEARLTDLHNEFRADRLARAVRPARRVRRMAVAVRHRFTDVAPAPIWP
jgi:hypothetical protein